MTADRWYVDSGAYAHLQRNTPQTAAYGLNDSPAALAAWIVEKFRDWSDCDGEVERRFSKDELLSNVTLYWMTETIHSSCRLYYESKLAPLHFKPGEKVGVPCAVAHFPKEAPFPPRPGSSAAITFSTGLKCRAGPTSPPLRNRSCWPATSPSFSTPGSTSDRASESHHNRQHRGHGGGSLFEKML